MPLGAPHRINSIYRQLTEGPFPPHESSFLHAISLRAVDAIVLSKELGDLESRLSTERFLDSFTVRIEQIATASWVFLVVVARVAALCFIYLFLEAPTRGRGAFENFLSLLPILGLPGVGVLLAKRQQIEAWFKRQLLRFFKYPM